MAAFVIIGFSVDNHFRGEDFVHNDSVAFDVEDDVQLFVACAQLLGVGMIMADGMEKLSSTACSNFSINSSTVCILSLGVGAASLMVS